MNRVNHLRRLQFRTLSYSQKKVVLTDDRILVKCGREVSRWCWIEVDAKALEHGRWDRTILSAFANASDTPAAILEFTEQYGPITSDLWFDEQKDTTFTVEQWRSLQAEFRSDWDWITQSGRTGKRFRSPGNLPVLEGELFLWVRGQTQYQTANLYRLLLLELHSLPEHRVRKCLQQGCTTPYFISNHRNQRHCVNCKASAHRAVKRASWHRNKQHWRARSEA